MRTPDRSLAVMAAAVPTALFVLALSSAAPGVTDHHHAAAAQTPSAPVKSTTNSCKTCLERGALLDPNLFTRGFDPEVKLAYLAARKYPDLIDRIHCFCECKENKQEHHKTLLTCFASQHAAGCGVCQHEAILAAQLKDQGASDDEVEITVESVHRTEGHPPTFGRGL